MNIIFMNELASLLGLLISMSALIFNRINTKNISTAASFALSILYWVTLFTTDQTSNHVPVFGTVIARYIILIIAVIMISRYSSKKQCSTDTVTFPFLSTDTEVYIGFAKNTKNNPTKGYLFNKLTGEKYLYAFILLKSVDGSVDLFGCFFQDGVVYKHNFDVNSIDFDEIRLPNVSGQRVIDFYLKTSNCDHDTLSMIGIKSFIPGKYYNIRWCKELIGIDQSRRLTASQLYDELKTLTK
jgi:hypothetical protein